MPALPPAERMLNQLDVTRLSRLDDGSFPPELDYCLDNADVFAWTDIPDDVVTMNSVFMIVDSQSGQEKELVLCYPEDADPAKGHISVLSPAGASMLGLQSGATASWQTPQGDVHSAVIGRVLFQPEASGEFSR